MLASIAVVKEDVILVVQTRVVSRYTIKTMRVVEGQLVRRVISPKSHQAEKTVAEKGFFETLNDFEDVSTVLKA